MGEDFNINDILSEDEISSLFSDETEENSQDSPPESKENNKKMILLRLILMTSFLIKMIRSHQRA